MIRYLAVCGSCAVCLAGCSTPTAGVRFVPRSSVVRVEPQPTTYREYREAERQGFLVAATGRGLAEGIDDLPTQMHDGEGLHVLAVDPATGEVVVRRLDDNTLARVDQAGLEVRATTYPD